MDKKIILNSIFIGLAFFIFNSVVWVHAAEETDAYCVAPQEAVPHGSTVALTIKFSDSDKSNDIIVQGPFKILKYENGKPIIVTSKRGNDKDDTGKENPEKPTLTFSVILSPKHKLPAPATESVTLTYFVKHKEGKRGELFTTDHEQQVDCSFIVQHETEESTTPSGGGNEDATQKNIVPADLGINNTGTLPTSRWYFLKEWRRGFKRFVTFNSVKKTELELRIMNEKAAEALAVQETKPDDEEALARALENYIRAGERLEARLTKLKEVSENPNVEKLLEKLDEQTLKHALLLNQLAERWNTDPYVEDANVINPQGARDNHLQGAVDIAQKKIQDVVLAAAKKDNNIELKAAGQIKRADIAIHELELGLAEFAINEPGVSNNRAINTKGTGAVVRGTSEPDVSNEKTGPIRIDSTPARISTNMTIERQTPKRDFGDRMKAGLDTAGGMLASAQALFAEGKFGEAFGQARAAEVIARNGLRILEGVLRADTGGLEDGAKSVTPRSGTDADAPRIEDMNSAMPIVPGTGGKIIPEPEKRVFPETNNKEAACPGGHLPACPRGEILECHDGAWSCIGPATGGGIIVTPPENLVPSDGSIQNSY